MLRLTYVLLLLLPATLCLSQPKIVTVPDTLNFGIVPPQDFLQGVVKILNEGTDTLKIKNIGTSCGCTAATPDASKIAFMETANLRVSVNISRKTGEIIEWIVLSTNDPKSPTKNIAVMANIVPPDTTGRMPQSKP